MTPEGKIKAKVKKLLDRYPHYRFMPVQTGMGKVGLDFYVCSAGRFCAIETKAPGKMPTTLQAKTIKEIREQGAGETFVIDGSDIGMDALERWLMLGGK